MTQTLQVLFMVGFVYILILAVASGAIIYYCFKKEQRMTNAVPAQKEQKTAKAAQVPRNKILEDAQKLYNEGKWADAIVLLSGSNLEALVDNEEIAEANRIKGWSWYYLGIKGPADKKEESLQRSKDTFQLGWEKTKDKKKQTSILNGLPLTLWILGEKVRAWEVSNRAIEDFPDEPSVWNTRSILARWAEDFKESVRVCKKVYETAWAKEEYRTAGHGQQNLGDAYILMISGSRNPLRRIALVVKALIAYNRARGCYVIFEKKTGEKATIHYEAATKKLLSTVRKLFK